MSTSHSVLRSGTTLYVLVADSNTEKFDYRSLVPENVVQWGFVESEEIFAAALRLQPWDVIIVDTTMLNHIPHDLLSADDTLAEGHEVILLVEAEHLPQLAERNLLNLCAYLVKGPGIEHSLGRVIQRASYVQSLRQQRTYLEQEIERILTGWELSIRDRTKTLERRARELQTIDELKNQVLENISHELRAPLTVIRSYVELLLECPPDDEQERLDFIRIIDSETQRLARMIDDVLDLARLTAGNMVWQMDQVDVRELIPKVIAQLQPIFRKEQLSCTLHLPCEIPPVWGDAERLTQVLFNLIENAVKFSTQGPIEIHADLISEDHDGEIIDMVTVSVIDFGPGIPHDMLEKVFERFAQAGNRGKRRGTGLGLAICREIISHHGGRIWATNHQNGAKLTFTIPLAGHLDVISGVHTIPDEAREGD